MRFDSLDKAVSVFAPGDVWVDEDACINIRGRRMACDACATACRAGALTLDLDAVELNDELCTGCGACLPACPGGAFRSVAFDPEALLAALAGQETVHLHCAASRAGGGGVVIPCHAVLDARLIAAAHAEGVREVVLHGLDACDDCGRAHAQRAVERLMSRLVAWLPEAGIVVRPAVAGETAAGRRDHHDQRRTDRRNFLRLGGGRAVAAAAWLVPVAAEEKGLAPAPVIGLRRLAQRPVPYQRLLAERVTALSWPGRVPPCTARHIDDACTACLACVERCPTGALSARAERQARVISHHTALCTNCGLCSLVCPERAIHGRPVATAEDAAAPAREIARRAVAVCGQCGQPWTPSSAEAATDLCPQCANEQHMDDEWLAMLGE